MPELRLGEIGSSATDAAALVIPLAGGADEATLADPAALPAATVASLRAAIRSLGLTGRVDEVTEIHNVPGVGPPLVALAGVGPRRPRVGFDPDRIRSGIGAAVRRLAGYDVVAVCPPGQDLAGVRASAEGAALGGYVVGCGLRPGPDRRIEIVCTAPPGAQQVIDRAHVLGEAVCLCRDLVNEPMSTLTPERFVEALADRAATSGVTVDVLTEQRLADGGFGGIASASAGSRHGARVAALHHDPPGAGHRLSLVGAGSAAAAAVAAATLAIARLGLPLAVSGYAVVVDRGPATRGVVRLRGGTSVEVVDERVTDTLVLADALAYACEQPADTVIAVGSLAGWLEHVLGPSTGGLLGSSDDLIVRIMDAAGRAGERIWPLPPPEQPLGPDDAPPDPGGDGLVGAVSFLAAVVARSVAAPAPWAHLDLFGPEYNHHEAHGHTPHGATGFGVATLIAVAEDLVAPVPTGPGHSHRH